MLVVRPLVAMGVTATYARCELKAGNCEAWSCSRTEVATCWRLAADGSFVIVYSGWKKNVHIRVLRIDCKRLAAIAYIEL